MYMVLYRLAMHEQCKSSAGIMTGVDMYAHQDLKSLC